MEYHGETTYVACIIAFQCLAVLVIGIRFFSKGKIVGSLGPDDWMMAMALLVYVVFTITSCFFVHIAQLGQSTTEQTLSRTEHTNAMRLLLATQILYNPILAYSKCSILLFYRRITLDQTFHRYCSITFVLVGAHAIAVFFGNLFQCTPLSTLFTPDKPGKCIDMSAFLLATGALSTLLDTWIILMPQRVILHLHLPLKKRLILMTLFSVGILLIIISITRLILIRNIAWHTPTISPTYSTAIIWSPIEVSIALICASIPSLRPLFTKWFPSFFHTSFEFDAHHHHTNFGMDEFGNRKEGAGGFRAKILALGNGRDKDRHSGSQEAVIKVHRTVMVEEEDHGMKTTNEIEISHVLERRETHHSGSGSETVVGDEEEFALGKRGSPPGLDGLHLRDEEEEEEIRKQKMMIARPRYM
ncbi:hypothetical protein EX30DRAFT_212041 [Ascodesmis nigricans]|uniref:Rhodopsin domain-containing protein n=1 Tax=Ascodesmis nigricans TaxID=341454 RepID=A0A4S2MQX8_9PEZI|nr:hypothetical protein EX30DRAFT_212041 [Ascodesmis nigricans]